jgi:hypothetical protein
MTSQGSAGRLWIPGGNVRDGSSVVGRDQGGGDDVGRHQWLQDSEYKTLELPCQPRKLREPYSL